MVFVTVELGVVIEVFDIGEVIPDVFDIGEAIPDVFDIGEAAIKVGEVPFTLEVLVPVAKLFDAVAPLHTSFMFKFLAAVCVNLVNVVNPSFVIHFFTF